MIGIVNEDLTQLAAAGRQASLGDTRCIVFGHLTRIAVWNSRMTWDPSMATSKKISIFHDRMIQFGDPDELARSVPAPDPHVDSPLFELAAGPPDKEIHGAVSF